MEIEEAGEIIEIAKEATPDMTDSNSDVQCTVESNVSSEDVEDKLCPTPVSENEEMEDVKKSKCPSASLDTGDELLLQSTAKICENPPSPSPVKNSSPPEERQNSIYHIKWISYHNQKTPIITQNENGPCPLIAIMNILILKGRVKLPLTVDIVTSEKLMQHLSECIIDSVPKNIPEETRLNYEQNVCDAMNVLPKLQTGLDVNVKFTGIQDFEYTPECVIFDLLGIPLYHGWLVDPQIPDAVKAVGKCSYNQLVEKIINFRSSQNEDNVTEALVAEAFLDQTASQLTYHGLCKLTSSLRDAELCVLFRNNHFISLIKHDDLLYQLVTDQGFLNENVVWESLNNIEGDSQFFDSQFFLVPPKVLTEGAIVPHIPADQQIDQDLEENSTEERYLSKRVRRNRRFINEVTGDVGRYERMFYPCSLNLILDHIDMKSPLDLLNISRSCKAIQLGREKFQQLHSSFIQVDNTAESFTHLSVQEDLEDEHKEALGFVPDEMTKSLKSEIVVQEEYMDDLQSLSSKSERDSSETICSEIRCSRDIDPEEFDYYEDDESSTSLASEKSLDVLHKKKKKRSSFFYAPAYAAFINEDTIKEDLDAEDLPDGLPDSLF